MSLLRGIRIRFVFNLAMLGVLLASTAAFAHPMGNFSISHYAGIRVEQKSIQVRYLIDMAEIPTFQEIQQNALVTKPDDPGTQKYLSRMGETLKAGLVVTLNGEPLRLKMESAEVIFPPGAGGLPTMKLGFTYIAAVPESMSGDGQNSLSYRDNNFPGRIGWKEVVATAGPGVSLVNSSVPRTDRSSQLANYPTDLLSTPPLDVSAEMSVKWNGLAANPRANNFASAAEAQSGTIGSTREAKPMNAARNAELSARLEVHHDVAQAPKPTAAPARLGPANSQSASSGGALQANQQRTPQSRFTELMTTRQFGFWFLMVAAAVAAGLGALHALEPGHGKTLVAAYLVGSKGTAYHAFLLGMIVTISHTAGVYALGAVTLYASRYIVPEQLYPWLGALSGLTIAGLGSYLFLRRYAGDEVGHSHGPGGHHQHHPHPHEHVHEHHGHTHGHDAHGHHHDHDQEHEHQHGHEHAHSQEHGHHHEVHGEVSYRQLLALGITGGIVPCPAALVVLLSAVALHRVAFGLFLIVAFSVGLAAVLIGVGLLMVYARRFMTRLPSDGLLFTRWMPLTSAAAITVIGVAIAIRSLITGGVLQIRV